MIIGHHAQQKLFRQALAAKKLSHAYILSGPEGVGKKQFAKEFGRGLLCHERRMFAECDCPSCRQVSENTHPDFYLFDTSESLKIESVRQIAEISDMTTYSGGWKVVIFDNAHILCHGQAEAANALLKTLEEPGQNTVFFLITHRLGRILPTIQSRSVVVNFEALDERSVKQILTLIGKPAGEGLEFSSGSVSRALIMQEIDAAALKYALDEKNAGLLANIIFKSTNKEHFAAVLSVIRQHMLNRYKIDSDPRTMVFIQYVDQALKNLDYNINMSLAVLDAFVKFNEVPA